jgi:NitT/TauT family transport system substrate-binding protein
MKLKRKAHGVLLFMFILLLVFATACADSKPSISSPAATGPANPSVSSAPETKEIPLNLGTLKIGALTNLYAAEKLGHFKEQGLKVTFTQMGGGAELLPAVSAGKIDIALSIPSPAIQAREKGFDFKMVMQNEVAAKQGRDSQALFVRADGGIADVKGLKEKRIAVNNIGNQTWLSVVEVLSKNGIDKKDVHFIELPYPNMEDSLLNKQVDAVFNVEPFTTKMDSSGKFKIVSYVATESLPMQPLGAFWASEKWYKNNEKTAEKFVAAMQKTNEYLAQHPDEAKKLIAEYTGIDIAVIEKMSPIIWDSKVDKATVQGLLDLMQKHAILKDKMNADSVLFPSSLK